MPKNTHHYVNVGQTIAIVGGLILGGRYLKLAETKAGIERRTIKEVVIDDIDKVRDAWRNFRYRQYRHY